MLTPPPPPDFCVGWEGGSTWKTQLVRVSALLKSHITGTGKNQFIQEWKCHPKCLVLPDLHFTTGEQGASLPIF